MLHIVHSTTENTEHWELSNWDLPTYLEEMWIAGFNGFKVVTADDCVVTIEYMDHGKLITELITSL